LRYKKNRVKILHQVRIYRAKNIEKVLLAQRLARLRQDGLPESEIQRAKKAVETHNGKCWSCGTTIPGGKGTWCVEHDHKRKRFRGITCHGCNAAIGYLHDNPRKAEAVARYLRTF
jgi:ribosomal protein L24E